MKVPHSLIRVTGDIKFSRWPMFIQYRPHHYALTGGQVEEAWDVVEAGDILLRRYFYYLNTMLTPGFWGHAGVYVGGGKVIHAMGAGVVKESFHKFLRTDSVCIRRVLDGGYKGNAILKAYAIVGNEYDFDFEIGDDKYSCAELVNYIYDPLFINDYEEVRIWPMKARVVITPGGIYRSGSAGTIMEARNV